MSEIVSITLSDDDAVMFQAYVDALQAASEATPPPFPPVMTVANVEELVDSFMEAPRQMVRQWYAAQ